jgi:hypothetical protein
VNGSCNSVIHGMTAVYSPAEAEEYHVTPHGSVRHITTKSMSEVLFIGANVTEVTREVGHTVPLVRGWALLGHHQAPLLEQGLQ